MNYQFPFTIQSVSGEKLTYMGVEKHRDGDKLLVENSVPPNAGPPMHTHFLQEEALTVVKGRIGYQVMGQEKKFAEAGETVVFAPGVAHKFWNAGNDELHCTGYIQPANNMVFFLSGIYAAQHKSGSERPEMFDAAYLLTRYRSEFEMNEIPWFVRKAVMPVTFFIGKLLGKYKHFKNAPAPIKP